MTTTTSSAAQGTDLRYPIGKFHFDGPLTKEQREQFIEEIAHTPAKLRAAVAGLTSEQLNTPYRPGGWTVRQLIHHLPDSHMNSYVRFRLALTEEQPTIKPYDEARWAELVDAKSAPREMSLTLLDALHRRWVILLNGMTPADYQRTLVHPQQGQINLEKMLAIYAWHGRHHVAHITALKERMGWK
ncbi:MAG TPA: bacillithiol transferase BstA [Terriglobales bacterium]|nr:bacillithiol transferase BstA [Terriglobales bacterium]